MSALIFFRDVKDYTSHWSQWELWAISTSEKQETWMPKYGFKYLTSGTQVLKMLV